MGSLEGHILPGTFFILFALRWAWTTTHRYCVYRRQEYHVLDNRKHARRYTNMCSTPVLFCGRSFPMEGVCKIVAAAIGIIGEYATAFKGTHFAFGNGQHMTMFFYFGLHGAVEMLQFYTYPLPPDLDYLSGILAFGIEALLFYYHLHGRAHMDIQVHMFLFYVILGTVISLFMELKLRHNVLPGLSRAYFTLLQGTWFYQVGFILYPIYPENAWDKDDHMQMMIVTLIFVWHNAAVFMFLLLAGTFIYWRVKRMEPSEMYYYMPPHPHNRHDHDTLNTISSEQIKKFISTSDDEDVC